MRKYQLPSGFLFEAWMANYVFRCCLVSYLLNRHSVSAGKRLERLWKKVFPDHEPELYDAVF